MRPGGEKLCDVSATCPFFRDRSPQSIGCEGMIPDTTLRTIFTEMDQMKLHYRVYCCKRYTYCEVFRMLTNIYKEL